MKAHGRAVTPGADGGAHVGLNITQRLPVISISIRHDNSRGINSVTVMLRLSLNETPCDLAKAERRRQRYLSMCSHACLYVAAPR